MKAFAVFGDPIAHSKSPRIHNNAIKNLAFNGFYGRYHLTKADDLKSKLFSLKLNGANITIPFKEQALKIADFKDEMALNIGSANTLLVKNEQIYAYNTDGIGFLKAIAEFKDLKTALILGAGGTAKALSYALLLKNIKVSVANRSKERLKDFTKTQSFLYEELKIQPFDLIINTTPAGLNDRLLPCDANLLKGLLQKAKYAFEVIYGKETPFLSLAKSCEIPCKDGADMLLWQGVFAFELFWQLCDEPFLQESKQRQSIVNSMQEALRL